MELQVGTEPMTLGSPTSPKSAPGAQFLPGFLMGDLPAPASPQPRPFSLNMPLMESTGGGGGSAPQPVVPTPKDKSGAPPVRSIHDDMMTVTTPLNTLRQSFPVMQSPLSVRGASTPGVQQMCLSPAQVDPFYSQGESLSSDDYLDQTWITMASPGNWMHLQYQSRLQARKALSKDGKVFGDAIMVGVKPCIDKSVMDGSVAVSSPLATSFSSVLPSTPRSAIRPLSAAYRSSCSDYQVVSDRQTPRKDDSFVSKAMEYMFGW
ncbi:Nucleoporin NUP53 [Liparis tanakae]|uniref:Nucleoporin NUP35 n=1 Tax=Liparis tanakae TaxID=230148 RepID=A0A4Z2IA76_9TELE|nr:Nucleoporin NUP53 [Liparis tanakae]